MGNVKKYLGYISVSETELNEFLELLPIYKTSVIFDGSCFWKELKGSFIDPNQYTENNEDIVYSYITDKFYSDTDENELKRISRAVDINERAAYNSIVFTKYFLPCRCYKACGFISAKEMYNILYNNEDAQLIAFIRLLKYYNFHKLLRNKRLTTNIYLSK